ncbi:DUF2878 domain-containing protein [Ahniella affigens]|uniref:DUF2878 domain-containing protein n=1 Tax=Ahniella affigens TaxID=2021234 RepID=A0A2P1PS78_9GAMM|nr:DUF2878 domain-containing protein [Ahniella affigens]AVP97688.1 DUF2878 domain-containing protein [Ahniella affigens]
MRLANALLFQALWFSAVLGAAKGLWWPALPVLGVLIAFTWRYSPTRAQDFRLLGVAVALGMIIETGFAQTGWIRYAAALPSTELAPVWILLMWAGFALTINHSLAPLMRTRWLALLSGAVFGPLAYFGAARLGAVESFGLSTLAMMLVIGVAWALSLLLLAELARVKTAAKELV